MNDEELEAATEDTPVVRLANGVLLDLLRGEQTVVRLRSSGGPVEARSETTPWQVMMEPPEALAEPLAKRFAEMINASADWPGPCQGFLQLVLGPDQREGFHVFLRPRRAGDVRVVMKQAVLRPEVQSAAEMKSDAVLRAAERFMRSPTAEADASLRQAMDRAENEGLAGVAALLDGIWVRVQHHASAGQWSEADDALAQVEGALSEHWGDGPELTQIQAARGQMALEAGDLDQARQAFEAALEGARRIFAFHPMAADLLDSLADIADRQGRGEDAARLWGDAATLLAELDPEDALIDQLTR